LDKTIQLGLDMERGKVPRITLTEVVAIKLYVDVYIHRKASEYFDNLKKKEQALEGVRERNLSDLEKI